MKDALDLATKDKTLILMYCNTKLLILMKKKKTSHDLIRKDETIPKIQKDNPSKLMPMTCNYVKNKHSIASVSTHVYFS